MKKIIYLTICAVGISFALSGCSSIKSVQDDMMGSNLTHQQQICNKLKRQLIFSQSDPNIDTRYHTPAQKAYLVKQYKKNKCEELEQGK